MDGIEYATLDQLLADDRIQIVASCTHPDVRADHCVRAAEAGRHIVIEKPVGLSMQETLRIREAVAKAGVKTVTSFVLRWNPQFETLRQLIDDGLEVEVAAARAALPAPHGLAALTRSVLCVTNGELLADDPVAKVAPPLGVRNLEQRLRMADGDSRLLDVL